MTTNYVYEQSYAITDVTAIGDVKWLLVEFITVDLLMVLSPE